MGSDPPEPPHLWLLKFQFCSPPLPPARALGPAPGPQGPGPRVVAVVVVGHLFVRLLDDDLGPVLGSASTLVGVVLVGLPLAGLLLEGRGPGPRP